MATGRPPPKIRDGQHFLWDSQHGAWEKYNSNGRHLGEFDPTTGSRTKNADPSRNIRRYL
ncbi:colicin E3/pyocin S6 family cytotoxin [Singulisphaera sp. GP187]|uniref:colicin E3/pyocin S6 family cytotoxin n=1 Tax=Singulisphaera sp. GP187 TaxID=1882752 RepID=UPI000940F12E